MNVDEDNLGDLIIKLEFEIALKEQKNHEPLGIDGIQTKILKFVGEEAINRPFKLLSST